MFTRDSTYTLHWQVVKLDRVLDAGFNSVVTVVEGLDEFSGHQVKLIAKNEFYIARIVGGTGRVVTDGPVLACTPDLICVIDSDKGIYAGIHVLVRACLPWIYLK